MISFDRNIIFIHNQKCAGTSIEKSFFTREERELHRKNKKISSKLYHSGISGHIEEYSFDFVKKCTIFSITSITTTKKPGILLAIYFQMILIFLTMIFDDENI